MTEAADLVVRNAEIHTLGDPDERHEALAIRDGRVVRVGSDYEIGFLEGIDTRTLDLDGRVVLPGFVDAHTHLATVGRSLVHADLSGAASPEACVTRLRDRAEDVDHGDWVLGFGYDESGWDDPTYLRRDRLDAASDASPVAAFREDMHVASLNTVALERLGGEMPEEDVHTENGRMTGVVVEEAANVVYRAVEPDRTEMRRLVTAAQQYANERGVTMVHDMVRDSQAPRVYRDLAGEGALTLRVRINYWSDHLDALEEVGLRTNHGDEMVQTGAIKTFTDGSIGGRTARLSDPYDDWSADAGGEETGKWVVPPAELRSIVSRAERAGFQVAVHAIGDVAIDEVLDAFADREDPGEMRHRIEHLELATDEAIDRLAEMGVVASMQPNFHKWAGGDGLYASRLGPRRTETNRLDRFREAGAHLAFGSDCMPLDPLVGVHHAVTADHPDQRLGVTDALRAYTAGAAYAGFDEDRLGTLEAGTRGDLTVLDRSPWEHPESIRDVEVDATVVGGRIVYDRSSTRDR
jgi:hypothetical protein